MSYLECESSYLMMLQGFVLLIKLISVYHFYLEIFVGIVLKFRVKSESQIEKICIELSYIVIVFED